MAITGKNDIQLSVGFSVDKAGLKDLEASLDQIIKDTSNMNPGEKISDGLQAASNTAQTLKGILSETYNADLGTLNVSKFNQQLSESNLTISQVKTNLLAAGTQGAVAYSRLANSILSTNLKLKQTNTLLDTMADSFTRTITWSIASNAINTIVGNARKAVSYVKDLNESLTNIRIVSGESAENMDKFAKAANEAAQELGATTLDYTNAALIFYQQGLGTEEAAARTEVVTKMSNVLGTSSKQVSDYMTAIWNNFDDGSESLEHYADVITALGASTASSSEEIANGLGKFASVSETVGLSYEYATSALATVVATTRQSADTVGTAFKTLFARIQSLKLGETLDDGTTLGSYSEALAKVGVSIKDQEGNLKDMNTILDEMGAKWNTLSKDQQVALAEAVAGVRQYTQLMALMNNYDFFQENIKTATESYGTLNKQQAVYMEGTEAHLKNLKAAWQSVYSGLLDDDTINAVYEILTKVVKEVDKFIKAFGGGGKAIMAFGAIVSNIFSKQITNQINNAITSLKNYQANVNTLKAQMEIIQNGSFGNGPGGKLSTQDQGALANLNAQLEIVEKIQSVKAGMSNEAYNEVIALSQQYGQVQEILVQEEARKNLAEKQLSTYQGLTVQTSELVAEMTNGVINADDMGTAYGQLNAKISTLYDLLQKANTVAEEIKQSGCSTQEQFTQLKNTVTKVGQELLANDKLLEKFSYEERNVLDAFINIEDVSAITEEQLQQIARIMQKFARETNTSVKGLKSCKAAADDIANSASKIRSLTAKGFGFKQAAKEITDAAKQAKALGTVITGITGSLSSMAMGFTAINSIIDVWQDDSKNATEKITQSLMYVGIVASNIIPTFVKMSEYLAAEGESYNVLSVAINKYNAQQLLSTKYKDELNGKTVKELTLADAKLAKQKAMNLATEAGNLADKALNAAKRENVTLTGEEIAGYSAEIITKNKNIDTTNKETLSEIVNNMAKQKGVTLTGEEVAAIIADILAKKKQEQATYQAAFAQEMLNATMKANPFILIASLVLALVSAMIAAAKAIDNARQKQIEFYQAQRESIAENLEQLKAIEKNQQNMLGLISAYEQGIITAAEFSNSLSSTTEGIDEQALSVAQLTGNYTQLKEEILAARKATITQEKRENEKSQNLAITEVGLETLKYKYLFGLSTGTVGSQKINGQKYDSVFEFNSSTQQQNSSFVEWLDENGYLKDNIASGRSGNSAGTYQTLSFGGNSAAETAQIVNKYVQQFMAENPIEAGSDEIIRQIQKTLEPMQDSLDQIAESSKATADLAAEQYMLNTHGSYGDLTKTGEIVAAKNEFKTSLKNSEGYDLYAAFNGDVAAQEAAIEAAWSSFISSYGTTAQTNSQIADLAEQIIANTIGSMSQQDKEKLISSSQTNEETTEETPSPTSEGVIAMRALTASWKQIAEEEKETNGDDPIFGALQESGSNADKTTSEIPVIGQQPQNEDSQEQEDSGKTKEEIDSEVQGIIADDIYQLLDDYRDELVSGGLGEVGINIDVEDLTTDTLEKYLIKAQQIADSHAIVVNVEYVNDIGDAILDGTAIKDFSDDQLEALNTLKESFRDAYDIENAGRAESLGILEDIGEQLYQNQLLENYNAKNVTVTEDELKSLSEVYDSQIQELKDSFNEIWNFSPDDLQAYQKAQNDLNAQIAAIEQSKQGKIAQYTKDINSDFSELRDQTNEIFESLTDSVINFGKISENVASKIGENFIVAFEDVEDVLTTLPELVNYIEQTYTDGSVKISQEGVELYKSQLAEKAEADIKYQIAKVDLQITQLQEEKKQAEAALKIAQSLANGEISLTEAQTEAQQTGYSNLNTFINDSYQTWVSNSAIALNDIVVNTETASEYMISDINKITDAWNQVYIAATSGNGKLVTTDAYSSGDAYEREVKKVSNLKNNPAEQQKEQEKIFGQALSASLTNVINARENEIANLYSQRSALLAQKDAITTAIEGIGKSKDKESSSTSEATKELIEDLKDEIDIYHDINIEIQNLSKELERLKKQQDRLVGKGYIDNLNKQLSVLKKQTDAYSRKIKLAKEDAEIQKANLWSTYGFSFDNNNQIANYQEVMRNAADILQQTIDWYNSLSADEQDNAKDILDAAQNRYDAIKDLVNDYDTLITETIPDLEDQIEDALAEEIEIQITKFEVAIQVKLDLREAEEEWNQFYQDVILGNKDSNSKTASLALANALSYYNVNGSGSGSIQAETEAINTILTELRKMDAGEHSSIYSAYDEDSGTWVDNKAQALEDLKEYVSQSMQDQEAYLAFLNQIEEALLASIEDVGSAFQNQNDTLDFFDESIQHSLKMVQLLYGDDAYAKMDQYYSTLYQNEAKKVSQLADEAAYWKQQLDEARANGEDELIDVYTKKWEDAIKQMNSSIEDWAEDLNNWYANTINNIFDELSDKITNGLGLDFAKDELELLQDNATNYLDDINRAYRTQKLTNKWKDAINDASSVSVQRKLTNLMNEQLKGLEEKKNLSEYDIQHAEKMYDIAVKQAALEDAKHNKNKMRLKRDANGNYSYQYVADQDEIAKATQELADAQNDLWNFDKSAELTNQKERLAFAQDFCKGVAEIFMKFGDDIEGREAALALFYEQNGEKINYLAEQNATIRANATKSGLESMAYYYGQDVVNLETMTEEEQQILMEELIPSWDATVEYVTDSLNGENGLSELAQEAMAEAEDAVKDYNTEQEKIGEKAQEVAEQVAQEYPALEQAAEGATQDAKDEKEAIEATKKAAQEANEAFAEAINAAKEAAKEGYNYWTNAKGAVDGYKGSIDELNQSYVTLTGSLASYQQQASVATASASTVVPATAVSTVPPPEKHRYQAIVKTSCNNIPPEGSVAKQSENESEIDKFIRENQGKGMTTYYKKMLYDTGGYTGTWNHNGKLAFLHQKELVLNATDTENILSAVSAIRDVISLVGSNAFSSAASAVSGLGFGLSGVSAGQLEQQVHIEASFPNATSSAEIQDAFNNLINVAAQRVSRNTR